MSGEWIGSSFFAIQHSKFNTQHSKLATHYPLRITGPERPHPSSFDEHAASEVERTAHLGLVLERLNPLDTRFRLCLANHGGGEVAELLLELSRRDRIRDTASVFLGLGVLVAAEGGGVFVGVGVLLGSGVREGVRVIVGVPVGVGVGEGVFWVWFG